MSNSGHTKYPRGLHVARVFEIPELNRQDCILSPVQTTAPKCIKKKLTNHVWHGLEPVTHSNSRMFWK